MGLSQELRSRAASPPPPTFDLDQLIGQGRRRRFRRRAGETVAIAFVVVLSVVAAVVGVSVLRPEPTTQIGAPPTSPTLSPPASPAPAADPVADRLTAQLAHLPALLQIPPGTAFVNRGHETYPPSDAFYTASWDIGNVHFGILVEHIDPFSPGADSCPGRGQPACTLDHDELGDIYTQTIHNGDGTLLTAEVLHNRYAGVSVDTNVFVRGDGALPVGILAALRSVALDPTLTL